MWDSSGNDVLVRVEGTNVPSSARHPRRIGLVGCVRTKSELPRPAQDLYLSPLFLGRRRFVEHSCDEWWILSALHGLVHPDVVLAPYDVALKDKGRAERREWSSRVLADIDGRGSFAAGGAVEFHAGSEYRDFGLADGLERRGWEVVNPTKGMAIGQQLAFYRNFTDNPSAA